MTRIQSALPIVFLASLMIFGSAFAQDRGKRDQDTGTKQDSKQDRKDFRQDREKAWKPLIGKWDCQSAVFGGQAIAEETIKKTKLELSPGKYLAQTAAGDQKGKIQLIATASPKQMKIESNINDQPTTILTIYKFEKDELVLCYSFGEKFPTEFKSTAENGFLLARYARPKFKGKKGKKKR